jgi:hypothetical protein
MWMYFTIFHAARDSEHSARHMCLRLGLGSYLSHDAKLHTKVLLHQSTLFSMNTAFIPSPSVSQVLLC